MEEVDLIESTFRFGSCVIHIAEAASVEYGACVWGAAVVLGVKLATEPSLVEGKRVLELGCGGGLAGLTALACRAAHVTFTDLGSERHWRSLLVHATSTNGIPDAHHATTPLPWGDMEAAKRVIAEHGPFDVVLASDCLFSSAVLDGFCCTLAFVLGAGCGGSLDGGGVCYLAYQQRDDDHQLHFHFAKWGLVMTQIRMRYKHFCDAFISGPKAPQSAEALREIHLWKVTLR